MKQNKQYFADYLDQHPDVSNEIDMISGATRIKALQKQQRADKENLESAKKNANSIYNDEKSKKIGLHALSKHVDTDKSLIRGTEPKNVYMKAGHTPANYIGYPYVGNDDHKVDAETDMNIGTATPDNKVYTKYSLTKNDVKDYIKNKGIDLARNPKYNRTLADEINYGKTINNNHVLSAVDKSVVNPKPYAKIEAHNEMAQHKVNHDQKNEFGDWVSPKDIQNTKNISHKAIKGIKNDKYFSDYLNKHSDISQSLGLVTDKDMVGNLKHQIKTSKSYLKTSEKSNDKRFSDGMKKDIKVYNQKMRDIKPNSVYSESDLADLGKVFKKAPQPLNAKNIQNRIDTQKQVYKDDPTYYGNQKTIEDFKKFHVSDALKNTIVNPSQSQNNMHAKLAQVTDKFTHGPHVNHDVHNSKLTKFQNGHTTAEKDNKKNRAIQRQKTIAKNKQRSQKQAQDKKRLAKRNHGRHR